MAKKKINTTLEDLAKMVASGFENTATKQDLKGLETKIQAKLTEHDVKFNKLENGVDEIHEILARFEEGDILDLQKRVKILERTIKAINKHLQ